jgi:hypothetical protein
MTDDTVTGLLAAQTERKLEKMRQAIVSEQHRLNLELRLVDEALERKRARSAEGRSSPKRNVRQSDGLARGELLVHVANMNRHIVKAAEVKSYLATQGIERSVQAVRNGLVRLAGDGALTQTPEGFAVPSANGGGSKSETEKPAGTGLSLEDQEALS